MNQNIFYRNKIALTGPAPHILESVQNLSDYDYIARLNLMIPVSNDLARTTSSRCEIWYPANALLKSQEDLCLHYGVKYIRTSKKASVFIPAEARHKTSYMFPNRFLKEAVECVPNRGLKAIVDIVLGEPKELYITGLTFYQTAPYYKGYVEENASQHIQNLKGNNGGHLQHQQIVYFKKNIAHLKNVKMDEQLSKIIKDYKL